MTKPKLRVSVFLLQWIGNLLLILLAFAWLQVPDSHVWQFAFSILSATLLVVAFFCLHTRTFRMLHRTETAAPLWQRLFILLIIIVVGYFLLLGLEALRSRETLFAGYWNSRFSPGMRAFFTFPRLVRWQDHFYDLLQWLFAALLLPIAFIGGSTGLQNGEWKKMGRVYRKILYWIGALLAACIGTWITSLLVGWQPGSKPAMEVISVILRLGVAYTVDILLWCLVLGLVASYVESTNIIEPS